MEEELKRYPSVSEVEEVLRSVKEGVA